MTETVDLTADEGGQPLKTELDLSVKVEGSNAVHDRHLGVQTEDLDSSNPDTDMPMDQPGR